MINIFYVYMLYLFKKVILTFTGSYKNIYFCHYAFLWSCRCFYLSILLERMWVVCNVHHTGWSQLPPIFICLVEAFHNPNWCGMARCGMELTLVRGNWGFGGCSVVCVWRVWGYRARWWYLRPPPCSFILPQKNLNLAGCTKVCMEGLHGKVNLKFLKEGWLTQMCNIP